MVEVCGKWLLGHFEDGRKTEKDLKAAHEQQVEELYAQIGRLNTQLAWLKKKIWLRPNREMNVTN